LAGVEEVTHLAAYTTAMFQSSRGDDENSADPLSGSVNVIVLREALIQCSTHHTVTTFHFLRADAILDLRLP
jgi:hypothetical protein